MKVELPREFGYQLDEKNHLIGLQFALLNIVFGAIAFVCYRQGLINPIIESDKGTYASTGIFIVFVAGFLLCAYKFFRVGSQIRGIVRGSVAPESPVCNYLLKIRGQAAEKRQVFASTLQHEVTESIDLVRTFINALPLLGLLGTIIGLSISISNLQLGSGTEVMDIQRVLSALAHGAGIAFYTTLVGLVTALWLSLNDRLLRRRAANLYNTVIEIGERRE